MNTTVRAAQRFTVAIAIEIHCRRCGRAFVPSSAAIRSGPEIYRVCRERRPAESPGEKSEVHS